MNEKIQLEQLEDQSDKLNFPIGIWCLLGFTILPLIGLIVGFYYITKKMSLNRKIERLRNKVLLGSE